MDIRSVTVMVTAVDTARADILLTPERIYYRFATDSSIEDGELPPAPDFDELAGQVVAASAPVTGETPLDSNIKLQVFVNNRVTSGAPTEQSLARVVAALEPVAAEFAFLRSFL